MSWILLPATSRRICHMDPSVCNIVLTSQPSVLREGICPLPLVRPHRSRPPSYGVGEGDQALLPPKRPAPIRHRPRSTTHGQGRGGCGGPECRRGQDRGGERRDVECRCDGELDDGCDPHAQGGSASLRIILVLIPTGLVVESLDILKCRSGPSLLWRRNWRRASRHNCAFGTGIGSHLFSIIACIGQTRILDRLTSRRPQIPSLRIVLGAAFSACPSLQTPSA